jgi:hypothetical protein
VSPLTKPAPSGTREGPRDESQDPWGAVAATALLGKGGVAVLRGLLTDSERVALAADAGACHARAKRNESAKPSALPTRGGAPARAFTVASASAAHLQLHSDAGLTGALEAILGLPVVPSGGGSYSWYERAGDFLGVHRDVLGCDATLITCLAGGGGPGELVAYPAAIGQPLDLVRRDMRVPIPLEPGDSALLLGGFVPHEVLPIDGREVRLVSLMCYRIIPRA